MDHLLEVGEVVCSRFTIERFLGRGAVGEGYVAVDHLLNEKVVCKVSLNTCEAARDEFRQQYRKLRSIRSPEVAEPLGYFEHETRAIVVLEWIDGLDLDMWAKGQPLKPRLEALAQIASALNRLHIAGSTHGDLLGGVNVVVESGRGCVLIDPDPELWGHTSGSMERRGDRESLAFLIEQFAPEYASGVLARVVEGLRPNASYTVATDVVAAQLHATARDAPIITENEEVIVAAGASYIERVRVANEMYQRNRQLRAIAIECLGKRIEVWASKFELTVTIAAADVSIEAARDTKGKGFFLGRSIECRTLDGERWSIEFDETTDFNKPWPYGGRFLAIGSWYLNSSEGKIDLAVDDEGLPVFSATAGGGDQNAYPPNEQPMNFLDDTWILARLSDLTGTKIQG